MAEHRAANAPVSVCFPFVGDRIGGSHLSALLLLQNLDPTRYRPRVVVHQRGPLDGFLADAGVAFETLPLPVFVGASTKISGHALALARTTPVLVSYLAGSDIRLVHAHDGRMNLTWAFPTRLSSRRLVWHQRSSYKSSRLVRTMLRGANVVVCISEYVRAGLPDGTPRVVMDNPFTTTPAPRDTHRDQLTVAGASPDARIIGFVGNLTVQKRPFLFLEAAARMVHLSRHDLAFAIFGDNRDGLQPALEARAAELGLEGRVRFMGFRRPIDPWIASCDMLLAPEVGDGFGRTLEEAMLAGTPIVVSDSGGHREIVGAGVTGLLVAPENADAMAQAAAALLDDPDRASTMAAAARATAMRRYSAAAHANAMMDLYDSLDRGASVAAAGAHRLQ